MGEIWYGSTQNVIFVGSGMGCFSAVNFTKQNGNINAPQGRIPSRFLRNLGSRTVPGLVSGLNLGDSLMRFHGYWVYPQRCIFPEFSAPTSGETVVISESFGRHKAGTDLL